MKVTKPEIGLILTAGRRIALIPATVDKPTGRARFHRFKGPTAGHLKIIAAHLVGPLDEYVTEEYAQMAGHKTADEYRDEWCRTHKAVWTGAEAWEVAFELVEEREKPDLMRMAWDPGSNGPGADRKAGPEPEKVDARPFAVEAQKKWELDQAQRKAMYDAMPLDQKLKLVQQDERLRIAGRDDLRVIEKRLEAIWNRGNGKKAA